MPTIRSRCIKLAFRPLGFSDFQRAVAAACATGDLSEPDEAAMQKLFALSTGSPGRAVDFISGGLLSLADKVERVVDGLPKMDHALVQELIQSTAGARNAEAFKRLCDLIEERIEEKAREEAIQAGQPTASGVLGGALADAAGATAWKWKRLISIKEPSSFPLFPIWNVSQETIARALTCERRSHPQMQYDKNRSKTAFYN